MRIIVVCLFACGTVHDDLHCSEEQGRSPGTTVIICNPAAMLQYVINQQDGFQGKTGIVANDTTMA
jgi:hypothetical protein